MWSPVKARSKFCSESRLPLRATEACGTKPGLYLLPTASSFLNCFVPKSWTLIIFKLLTFQKYHFNYSEWPWNTFGHSHIKKPIFDPSYNQKCSDCNGPIGTIGLEALRQNLSSVSVFVLGPHQFAQALLLSLHSGMTPNGAQGSFLKKKKKKSQFKFNLCMCVCGGVVFAIY